MGLGDLLVGIVDPGSLESESGDEGAGRTWVNRVPAWARGPVGSCGSPGVAVSPRSGSRAAWDRGSVED